MARSWDVNARDGIGRSRPVRVIVGDDGGIVIAAPPGESARLDERGARILADTITAAVVESRRLLAG